MRGWYSISVKKIYLFILTLVIIVVGVFVWNSLHTEIKISSPASSQKVGMQFAFSGEISSILLKDSAFTIEILDRNQNSITGQLVEVSAPWWGQFVATPINFTEQINTAGMTSDTPTCLGPATLVIGNKNKILSKIPIVCE